jgi:hypothetical protein
METTRTSTTFVDYATLEGGRSITAVLPRREIVAALEASEPAQLWFDVGQYGHGETKRLTVDLAKDDLEEMLRLTTGDEVALALDAEAVDTLFESDVEAHGMRSALTIAVVAGAMMAPAGLAATPQAVGAAAKPQALKTQVSTASAKSQVSRASVESQVTRAAKPQVSRATVESQVTRAGAKSGAAKSQVAKSLVVKAGGISLTKHRLAG